MSRYLAASGIGAVVLMLCIIGLAEGLDNGLGKTPPMGWNSWNKFACKYNETVIKKTIDLLKSTGLQEKGYSYVNLDDCWQISRDASTKKIQYDKEKFPSGLQALIDYAHTKGFKFGLYSDAGTKTCQGRPGSYGYQKIDAQTYAEWGVDYLKYDNCHNEMIPAKSRYPFMRDALNATGRPIYFSMCEWGREKPWLWAQSVANSWRTTLDIKDIWEEFLYLLERQVGLSEYAGPGAWNDPDILEVGNGGMSHDQYQTHFLLWAALKAPLLIGCDLQSMSKQTLQILANEQVIALNQDPLGKQADLLLRKTIIGGFKQVWGGPLSSNRYILIFFNRSPEEVSHQLSLTELEDIKNKKITSIRDVIKHEAVDIPADGKTIHFKSVKKHASIGYVLSFE